MKGHWKELENGKKVQSNKEYENRLMKGRRKKLQREKSGVTKNMETD